VHHDIAAKGVALLRYRVWTSSQQHGQRAPLGRVPVWGRSLVVEGAEGVKSAEQKESERVYMREAR
jgi:hypothetical protein